MANPQSPVFPGSVAQDIDLLVAANRAQTKLTVAINAVITSFTVLSISSFNVPCLVQIDDELILVGVVSGDVFSSCVRGFGGSVAASHDLNAEAFGYVFAYHHNQIAAEIKSIEATLGADLANIAALNIRTVDIYDTTVGSDISPRQVCQATGTSLWNSGVLRKTISSDLIVSINLNGTLYSSFTIPSSTSVGVSVFQAFSGTALTLGDVFSWDITASDGSSDINGIASITVAWKG